MPYDSQATRQRILGAAASEFAEHGVAGARIDRIAARAEANKRAIYDYFGDKDRLFATVLEAQLTELAEAVPPGGDDLAGYCGRLFDYHREHPQALRLLMWEALELGDSAVPDEDARTRHYQHKVSAAAQAAHRDDADARTLLFFTLGLVAWSLAMPQLRRMILGPGYPLDQLRAAITEAISTLTAPGPAQNRPD